MATHFPAVPGSGSLPVVAGVAMEAAAEGAAAAAAAATAVAVAGAVGQVAHLERWARSQWQR